MKNKLKLTLLLLSIAIGIYGCQEDKIEHVKTEAPPSPEYKISKASNTFIEENELLSESILKLEEGIRENRISNLNKTVYSSEFDFTINTDYAKYIENDDASYHSFTFPIERAIDSGILENLLFSLQTDGSYKTFIVEYNITMQEQIDIENGIDVDLENKINFIEIDGSSLSTEIFSKTTVCGPSSQVLCWSTACEIDGCWDPMYTGSTCGTVIIHNICDGSSGGNNGDSGNSSSGGPSGAGAGNGSNDGSSDVTTIVTCKEGDCPEELCVTDEAISNLSASLSLTPDIISCLESEDNCNSTNQLNNFLNHSPNKTQFAELAAQAICDENEVDFVNEIIYEIDQKCAKEIVKKTLNNSSPLSQKILGYFNQDKDYTITYKNDAIPNGAQGAVYPLADCVDNACNINVVLNNFMLNSSTDVLIAKVALHETLHATLVYLFETGQFVSQGLDPNANSDVDYKTLLGSYIGYLVTNNPSNYIGSANQLQHNYINAFIDDMVDTLQVVGGLMGYSADSSIMQDEYLEYLVWSGSLEETPEFNDFDFNEQQIINSIGIAELFNNPHPYQTYDAEGNIINNIASPQANQINNTNEPCY